MSEVFCNKKVPALRGKTVVNLFYEPSPRPRSSFEIAERVVSAVSLSLATARDEAVQVLVREEDGCDEVQLVREAEPRPTQRRARPGTTRRKAGPARRRAR